MEKQRNFKIMAVIALVVSVLGVSVAFASMSATLRIGGTATMDPASWSVKFDTDSFAKRTTGAATIVRDPDISDTSISNFEVKLTKPGDSVIFTFDVVNEGTLDAVLTTFTKDTPKCVGTSTNAEKDATATCANLTYSLKYTGTDENVQQDNELPNKTRKSMTLTLAYDGSVLPENQVDITNLGIVLIYSQKSD